MIIGYARLSTTEQNLGLRHDDLKPAFDASVDQTDARCRTTMISGSCHYESLESRQELQPTGDPTPTRQSALLAALEFSISLTPFLSVSPTSAPARMRASIPFT